MKSLFCVSFLLFTISTAISQDFLATTSTSEENFSETDWSDFENEKDATIENNWSFHTDKEGKSLYIDFELLGGKMNSLVLISDQKQVVHEDNHLFDLPFNTIYELDLEKLKRGSYFVELRTFNHKIIRKEITIH
jgi:hypothetical protein